MDDLEVSVDIIIDVPRCKSSHNHTIRVPDLDEFPVDFKPFQVSEDNKRLIINNVLKV